MKLLVPYRADGELRYESVWVQPVSNGYRLDNIPFLADGLALGDVVEASEEDGFLYFEDIEEASGHSTVRILFWNAEATEAIRATADELVQLGCAWEGSHIPGMIAVDVPPTVDYAAVKSFLNAGFANKTWDYQEACLGFT